MNVGGKSKYFSFDKMVQNADLAAKQWILRQFDALDVTGKRDMDGLALFQSQIGSLLGDLTVIQRSQYAKGQVDNDLVAIEQRLQDEMFDTEVRLRAVQETAQNVDSEPVSDKIDISTLRQRLLASESNQFDSIDAENAHHDGVQSDLIDSLPSMVSAIREQALQFQEMLQHDASILKDVGATFELSQGKFTGVNQALTKYHKEGRLGLWFYVRVVGSIFLAFITLLVLIRLIPAR